MQFLVVEDDAAIAGQVCAGLNAFGHSTAVAATASAALACAEEQRFDAVVLDRMLPDLCGMEVLRRLRGRNAEQPILMLSALSSVGDRIEGLQAGADDYLTKPFEMGELAARLEAITRRHPTRDTENGPEGGMAVGALQLDPAGHSAIFHGKVAPLNRKQFSLLAHLMRNADRVVTRTMLLEEVWGYAFEPTANIVESNLSRLRTRLQDVGCDAIETKRGLGYSLLSASCR